VDLAEQVHDHHVVHRAAQRVRAGEVHRRDAARRVYHLLRRGVAAGTIRGVVEGKFNKLNLNANSTAAAAAAAVAAAAVAAARRLQPHHGHGEAGFESEFNSYGTHTHRCATPPPLTIERRNISRARTCLCRWCLACTRLKSQGTACISRCVAVQIDPFESNL
jgi:hypothetical protein